MSVVEAFLKSEVNYSTWARKADITESLHYKTGKLSLKEGGLSRTGIVWQKTLLSCIKGNVSLVFRELKNQILQPKVRRSLSLLLWLLAWDPLHISIVVLLTLWTSDTKLPQWWRSKGAIWLMWVGASMANAVQVDSVVWKWDTANVSGSRSL